ncbi:MAG TPA: discoidin domain-containing protein [Vicinamibacteria bacterium]|nr:discoidin domain-containing protein [Vicinamibacteria bacterium]
MILVRFRLARTAAALSAAVLLAIPAAGWAQPGEAPAAILVDATPSHAVVSFSPFRSLGAGIDRLRGDITDKVMSPGFVKALHSAGWQTVSYRQNTELYAEAWHWNPRGAWSNPAAKEGYFVGDARPAELIRHSWAAPLPHRGFTRGDGNGWSRLTDGDLDTYWKSNPYLTRPFTGEDDHPQWVTLDLGSRVEIDAVRIAWADPYAVRYRVQYWTGERDPFDDRTGASWRTFPLGSVSEGKGGTATVRIASWPVRVRWLRVWMTASSGTCDSHGSQDRRNCLGFAVRELYAGRLDAKGELQDVVDHQPNRRQSATVCSSVDPWHAETDLTRASGDQVGFDLFFTSGVTRGLPAMVPVAVLYSTPEDAAAQMAYLKARGYPISYVEMGEEADGQYMLPEDYGALYLQFAAALHGVDPALKLGGPSFEGVVEDVEAWPDPEGRASWLGRFFDYLRDRGRIQEFAFLSFEHYPYDACNISWNDLYREPDHVAHIVQAYKDDGLPPGTPFFVTEVNLGAQVSEAFVDIMGALWWADYTGALLANGGTGNYFFHYIPGRLRRGCNDSWGTFGMFLVDDAFDITHYNASYFAAQLINREWVQPVDQMHRVFRAESDARDAFGNLLVTAYALERPDGQWSLMLVNKDREQAHGVTIRFSAEGQPDRRFAGTVERVSFGANEYQWRPNGAEGHPDPDGPPVRSTLSAGQQTVFSLPRASITVLRGRTRP